MIITALWYFIDTVVFVVVMLGLLWLIAKYAHRKTSFSEHLFENAFQALKDLEDYYDDFPEKEREKALTALKSIAVQLAGLDRKRVAKDLENK